MSDNNPTNPRQQSGRWTKDNRPERGPVVDAVIIRAHGHAYVLPLKMRYVAPDMACDAVVLVKP